MSLAFGQFVTYGPSTGPLPHFPATDQDPAAARAAIGGLWVDYVAPAPTAAQVLAQSAPTAAQLLAAERAALAAAIDAPTVQMRVVVAIASLYYADMVAMVPAFKAKYPTLASYVAAVKAQVNVT
jgi:CTP:molybdopterin cytidylyltransferase MocA